jgi:type IV pilus assembly protein PilQ
MKRAVSLVAALLVVAAPQSLLGRDGEVKAISILPAPGRADVLIGIRGSVDVQDFTLAAPARIVIDVLGAQLQGGLTAYDGHNRGGVINIRYAQFRSDVVRVVVEVDALKDYRIERTADGILLSLGTERDFAGWSSETGTAELEPTSAQQVSVTTEALPVTLQESPRITASWDSTSIVDVIAAFAAYSGRTIIPGKGVTGMVRGVEIRNQPWDAAFQAFLEAYGLAAEELPSGILRVDDQAELAARDTLQPLETRLIAINYAKAVSMVPTVEAVLTREKGRVVADTGTNALVITDFQSRMDDIEQFVRGLDVQTPQVSIQAKLIFVDRLSVEEFGIKYDLGTSQQFFNKLIQRPDPTTSEPVDLDLDGNPDVLVPQDQFPSTTNIVDLGGSSLSAIGNADATIINPALELIYSTALGNFDISFFLNALQRVELADIQAEPVATVLNNREASVLVGDKVPIRIVDVSATTTAGTDAASVPRATVRFEETGIRLVVTPHVTTNRQVLMDIHAERSTVRLAPVDIGYTFQTQEATTQVLVEDGESAVIGGLTVTEVSVTKSGIPYLVDLPIIGPLFGFSSQQEIRRDLLILVTPHIIDDLASNSQN